jgi:hypothetical protein
MTMSSSAAVSNLSVHQFANRVDKDADLWSAPTRIWRSESTSSRGGGWRPRPSRRAWQRLGKIADSTRHLRGPDSHEAQPPRARPPTFLGRKWDSSYTSHRRVPAAQPGILATCRTVATRLPDNDKSTPRCRAVDGIPGVEASGHARAAFALPDHRVPETGHRSFCSIWIWSS